MKSLTLAVLLALLSPATAAEPAKKATIDRLLVALDTEATAKSLRDYFSAMMKGTYERLVASRTLTEEQRLKLEELSRRLAASMNEELGWEGVKALYEQLYADNFTEAEMRALVKFYESPPGRAFAKKLPLIAQKAGASAQERVSGLSQRLNEGIRDALGEGR